MPAKLSTHVLDTANGCPAHGMRIELWTHAGSVPKLLKSVQTNSDGRTEQPLLTGNELKIGHYELVFFVGDYFKARSPQSPGIPFLDRVPVRIGISDAS